MGFLSVFLRVICLSSLLLLIPSAYSANQAAPAPHETPVSPEKEPAPIPESGSPQEGFTNPFTTSYEGTFLKMIFALVGILVFLFIAAWALKRLSQGKLLQRNFVKKIKIIESRPLSPKSMLHLIEVGGKEVLIAESQVEVRCLTTIQDSSTKE